MTPHHQLIMHDPDNGVWGDCGRTVVACLLDMHPSEVPHFWDGGRGGFEVDEALNLFLKPLGMFSINLSYAQDDVQGALDYYGSLFFGSRYIFVGKSRTGCNHAVVACNNRVEHDPSPHKTGIVGPSDDGTFLATIFCRRL